MLQHHPVGDPRHTLAFVVADRGVERPGGYEKDPFPGPVLEPWQDIGTQDDRGAAAPAASGMGILSLAVVQLDPTVHMDLGKVIALLGQKIQKDGLPYRPQIPRDDLVIILLIPLQVLEMLPDRVEGRRGHGRAHIAGVL